MPIRPIAGLLLLASMVITPAGAQRAPLRDVVLNGQAQTGTDTRAARIGFSCTLSGAGSIGSLAITLSVPRHDTLRAVFPFDDFEGPDADTGIRSRIEVTAGTTVQGSFGASGSIGTEKDQPFNFAVAGMSKNDGANLAAVARLLRPVTQGPARLVWRQEATRKKAPAIVATLDISAADAARLQPVLAPCLPSTPAAPQPLAASGLTIQAIRFAAGTSSATMTGGVIRGERALFSIEAAKGQRMELRVTSAERNAVFQLYAPGAKAATRAGIVEIEGNTLKGAAEGDDAMTWTGILPQSGRYMIVVGGTRGNASYRLDVGIK